MSDQETEQSNADSVRGYWEKEYRRAIKDCDELKAELARMKDAKASVENATAAMINDSGAPNFVQVGMVNPETGKELLVTVQRKEGKSPATLLTESRQLAKDVVDALPPDADSVWRALGYDPDGYPCWTDPLEPVRMGVVDVLARLRAVAGELDKLEDPPGPLCYGCDELIALTAHGVEVHDGKAFCDSDCWQRAKEEERIA